MCRPNLAHLHFTTRASSASVLLDQHLGLPHHRLPAWKCLVLCNQCQSPLIWRCPKTNFFFCNVATQIRKTPHCSEQGLNQAGNKGANDAPALKLTALWVVPLHQLIGLRHNLSKEACPGRDSSQAGGGGGAGDGIPPCLSSFVEGTRRDRRDSHRRRGGGVREGERGEGGWLRRTLLRLSLDHFLIDLISVTALSSWTRTLLTSSLSLHPEECTPRSAHHPAPCIVFHVSQVVSSFQRKQLLVVWLFVQ